MYTSQCRIGDVGYEPSVPSDMMVAGNRVNV